MNYRRFYFLVSVSGGAKIYRLHNVNLTCDFSQIPILVSEDSLCSTHWNL